MKLKPIEKKLLELVRQSADGLKPSEVVLKGYTVGQIRAAASALAEKGEVAIGADWVVCISRKYLGESQYGSVYQEHNGSAVAGKYNEPMEQCKFCSRWIAKCGDHQCDGCWEITHRLSDFINHPAGRKFVEECLWEKLK